MKQGIDRRNFLKDTVVALTTIAALGSLAGCAGTAPTPAATASQTGETPTKEDWANFEATVDKYPDAASAAEYLMGNADGDGVYSRILRYAGHRGEVLSDTLTAPEDALVALFGPMPADGYPEQVQNIIDDMNKKYELFAAAYGMTKDSQHPFSCTVSYTDISTLADSKVSGIGEEKCDTRSLPGDNKVNFKVVEVITLDKYKDAGGRMTWRITDIEDIKTIESPHDN